MVGGIVVQAEVGGKGECRILLVGAVEYFQGDAAAQSVCDVVGERGVEIEVFRRECAEDVAFGVGLFHGAVAEEAHSHGPCAALAGRMGVARSGEIGVAEIAHIVNLHLVCHLRPEKRRILVGGREFFFNGGDIHPSESVDS